MPLNRFYKSGDGAGAGTKQPDVTPGAAGLNKDGGGKAGGEIQAPDTSKWTVEDWKKHSDGLNTKLTETTGEVAKLKKAVGDQGNIVGKYNKMAKFIETDPKGLIGQLARSAKLNVKFEDDDSQVAPDLGKVFKDGDADAQASAIKSVVSSLKGELNSEFGRQFQVLHEAELARSYPDYDALAESRETLASQMKLGQLSREELLHFAARGINLKEALEDAKKQAVDEYVATLTKKNEEHIESGGSRRRASGKPEAGIMKLGDVLDAMEGPM